MRTATRLRSGLGASLLLCVSTPGVSAALAGASVDGEISYRVETASSTVNGVCWLQTPGDPSCFTDNGTAVDADQLPYSVAPFDDAIQYTGLETTRAAQSLALLEAGVVATGSHRAGSGCSAVENVPFMLDLTSESADSASSLAVGFDVDETSQYSLSGLISSAVSPLLGFGVVSTHATVRLEALGGEIVTASHTSLDGAACPPTEDCMESLEVDSMGVLEPGRYVLVAEAAGTAECWLSISTAETYDQVQESAFDVTLSLSPTAAVPMASPAALGVLAAALTAAGLVATRHRGT